MLKKPDDRNWQGLAGTSRATTVAVMIVLLLALPALGGAQQQDDLGEPDLRTELLTAVDNLLSNKYLLGSGDAVPEALEDARRHLLSIQKSELQDAAGLAPQIARMNRAFEDMLAVAGSRALANAQANPGFADLVLIKDGGFPSAAYPNLVQDISGSGDSGVDAIEEEEDPPGSSGGTNELAVDGGNCDSRNRSSTLEAYSARLAFIVIEAVRDIANILCGQSISLLVVGGNASLLCIVTDIVYIGGKTLHDLFFMCDDFIDAAEIEGSYERAGHLHDDLELHEVALADHDTAVSTKIDENKDTVVTAIGDAGDAILTSIAESRELFTRLEIEEALVGQDRQAIHHLPVARGGNLELAQVIVADAIANVIASGESVHDAQALADEAEALRLQGRYKKAFDTLSLAYFDAVKNGQNENPHPSSSLP